MEPLCSERGTHRSSPPRSVLSHRPGYWGRTPFAAESNTRNGEVADARPNDHEDNLYLRGWGIANEPVCNHQGTAYLLRDGPKAAIRTLYSYMASAFSHSDLDPVNIVGRTYNISDRPARTERGLNFSGTCSYESWMIIRSCWHRPHRGSGSSED